MTEEEWLRTTDPHAMLSFLDGKSSDRKMRLFACACCRKIWRLLVDPRSKEAVRKAEEFADGLLIKHDLEMAAEEAWEAHLLTEGGEYHDSHPIPDESEGVHVSKEDAEYHASQAAVWTAEATGECAARESAKDAIAATVCDPNDPEEDEPYQASLIRDIFGNPLRPVTFDPAWLMFDVKMIAAGAYEDRAFERLPILADALEDAGCDNADILNHLRGDGPHVRGCWALDFILGKS